MSPLPPRITLADEAVFNDVFRRYFAPLATFAYRYTGSVTEAQDIVQDVFLKLWVIRAEWEAGEESGIAAYLYKAVRNRALNVRKQVDRADQRAGVAATESGTRVLGNDGERAVIHDELERAIARAVQDLSPRGREIFELSRGGDLTYKEIAHVLGVAPTTVYTQMGRVLKTLHKALSEWEDAV